MLHVDLMNVELTEDAEDDLVLFGSYEGECAGGVQSVGVCGQSSDAEQGGQADCKADRLPITFDGGSQRISREMTGGPIRICGVLIRHPEGV